MPIVKKILPLIVITFLACLITFPLLSPGYILVLDLIPVPKVIWPSFFSSSFLYGSFHALLSYVIGVFWVQKLVLFLVFFLSGWSMNLLIREKVGVAKYFAIIFYMINPFVYERVMAGHWDLLLGYALFPYSVVWMQRFFEFGHKKNIAILALGVTLITSIAIHYSFVLGLFFLTYLIFYLFFHPDKISDTFKKTAILVLTVSILNINWILPSLLGISDISKSVSLFNKNDLVIFQSVDDDRFGLIFNLLSGYGFWPEVYNYFISPKKIILIWPVLSVFIIFISMFGMFQMLKSDEKKDKLTAIVIMLMFLLCLDFAGGIALKSLSNIIFSLYDNFPFLRGMREPQKVVGFLMFTYALCGSYGLYVISKNIKGRITKLILVSTFFIPFLYTPLLFGSFWGQLKPVFYPASWQRVNRILMEDKSDFITLFFPWHQYMRFQFANNYIISNPAENYFDKAILSSRNYETKYLDSHDTREEALHVEGLLRIENEKLNLLGEKVDRQTDWGSDLSAIGVKYIILIKDGDWQKYHFLDTSENIKKVYESGDLLLYQNLTWNSEGFAL